MYCFLKKFASGFCAVSRIRPGRDCAECKKAPESPGGLSGAEKSKKRGEQRQKRGFYSPSGAAFRMRRIRAFWSAYIS